MTEPTRLQAERIYLTGFMGSGKSTIGPILANTIGYEFADIDRSVEAEAGRSVSNIFASDGEARFRELEHELLLRMSLRSHLVVSLGGGTLVHPPSFQVVRATGVLVYLKMSAEEVFRRVRHRTDRPLLMGPEGRPLSPEDLRLRIDSLYRERAPIYETADIVVITDETRVGLTVDRVVQKLRPYLPRS